MSFQQTSPTISQEVINAIENSSLEFKFRQSNEKAWQESCNKLSYCPIFYENIYIDYQLAYQRFHGGNWHDISILIFNNHEAVGIWPLTFSFDGNVCNLTSNGSPITEPLFFKNTPKKLVKSSTSKCIDLMLKIKDIISLNEILCFSPFLNNINISNWQTLIMERGASTIVDYNLYINLLEPIEEIKSNFRKSYKSLINPSKYNYSLAVMNASDDEAIWKSFQEFHINVSGRITRSQKTWDLQYLAIKKNKAFLVYLLDKNSNLIGGAYIMHSNTEGLYFSGVYDRSLSHEPLSHIIQFQTIQELQSRGCSWYKLGHRHYQMDRIKPTEKELAISFFKEGFSSYVTPSYNLKID